MVIYHRSETRINKNPWRMWLWHFQKNPWDSSGGVNYPSWRAGVWPDTGDNKKLTWKLTWQWKNKNLKMYLQSKMMIFFCHVSFPGSFSPSSDDKMRNPRFSSGPVFPGSKWSFGAMERRCIWAAGGVCQQVFPPRTDKWNMMTCETYKHTEDYDFHCKFHVFFFNSRIRYMYTIYNHQIGLYFWN